MQVVTDEAAALVEVHEEVQQAEVPPAVEVQQPVVAGAEVPGA